MYPPMVQQAQVLCPGILGILGPHNYIRVGVSRVRVSKVRVPTRPRTPEKFKTKILNLGNSVSKQVYHQTLIWNRTPKPFEAKIHRWSQQGANLKPQCFWFVL